jgi:hypothetical protein
MKTKTNVPKDLVARLLAEGVVETEEEAQAVIRKLNSRSPDLPQGTGRVSEILKGMDRPEHEEG